MTLPTADQLYALAKARALALRATLTDWNAGSVLDALTGSAVVLADQVIRVVVDQFRARFIATATENDLDTAVTDRWPDLTREAPVGAVVTLTFDRGTNTGAINIPAATACRATVAGVTLTFTTDVAATIPTLSDTVAVLATCSTTGTAGNVAEDTIATIVTAIADDTAGDMTVTNDERAAGGAAEESDDAYRSRAQAYPATLGLATESALELAAIGVPGIAYATVNEDDPLIVYVYVSDADGNGNAALAAAAQVEVDAVVAAGVFAECVAASREDVELTVTVTVIPTTGTATLRAQITSAVLGYTGSLAPGQSLYFSAAAAAAIGVSGNVRGAVATSTDGSGNSLTPTEDENALRVQSADLTITFVEA